VEVAIFKPNTADTFFNIFIHQVFGRETTKAETKKKQYRAMHYSAKRGIEIACRLSYCNVGGSGSHKVEILETKSNKKALLSQRRPRDAPNIWVPGKVSRVLANAPGYFSRNL